jgi:hypothetical protein
MYNGARGSTFLKYNTNSRESPKKKQADSYQKTKHVIIDLHQSINTNNDAHPQDNKVNRSQISTAPRTSMHSQQLHINFNIKAEKNPGNATLGLNTCRNSQAKTAAGMSLSPNPTPPVCLTPLPTNLTNYNVGFHLEKVNEGKANFKLDTMLNLALKSIKSFHNKE